MKILQKNISRCFPGLLLSLFFILPAAASIAQVKFSAVCPVKKIGKNEYLQVQYIVENATRVEQILPPSFKDFVVVSGPNHQSGMSSINGNVKQYTALEFILKPQKAGSFTLPPATAKADGKNLLSNALAVDVTNSTTGGRSGGASFSPFGNIMADVFPASPSHQYDDYILQKGENIADKIKKNLFVNVVVNKTACYVGEPVIASYKLYTRLKSESNLTRSPSFNGFSVTDLEMPDNYQLSTEKFNGREYNVYTLRKVQLYPLQAGTVELEPVEVENTVTFIKADYANANKGDIFYDMMRDFAEASTPREAIEEQKVTLQSKPLNITVKALPEVNQPKDFKGAVGEFSINADVPKKSMTVDEAGNLIIAISGNGNIQMVNAPDIVWPDGVESFEPKSSENIDKTAVPLKGRKIFDYAFTFSKPGAYEIPPVTFSYFDISSHSYKTISTKPFTVTVKRGSRIKRAIASHLGNVDNSKLETVVDKIIGLRWILIAVCLAIAIVIVWAVKRTPKKELPQPVPAHNSHSGKKALQPQNLFSAPLHPLHDAEVALLANDAHNFYYTINTCLKRYLASRLNFPEKELGKKKIGELLDKNNVGVGTTLMLNSLLEEIELNLYAPASAAGQAGEVYEKAIEVIALLDKQLPPVTATA